MRQNVGVAQPSILDLGCGWGDLLADFLARGWQAVGVELSARRRNHAASLGVTIFETLGQAKKHGPFDAVLAVQYLEHDPYFPKTVGRLHDMLKPDGIAYFSVPSSETLFIYDNSGVPHLPPKPSPDINPFEHVNYFRPKDLVRVLHGTGFEVFDPNTFSPVKKLDGTYCVARKAKGV
jgi:2-polyprenyl-3-methyl-5-hydroxy-6-metoxy-1,4-benzoquinol methylase